MLAVASIALWSSLSSAQAGKVESLDALTDPSVPDNVRQMLAAKGSRVVPDANTAPLDIWFRKEIPAQPKPTTSDAIYDRLAESTLIGVLHFTQAGGDYREQSIAAGFYVLRYALMPNDGNHLGVAPSRDFLLLIPAKADPGPEKTLKFQELVALSRQASGTRHPAPLSLVPPAGAGLSRDEEGHVIFSSSVHLSSGEEMPLGIVVKGSAPQ